MFLCESLKAFSFFVFSDYVVLDIYYKPNGTASPTPHPIPRWTQEDIILKIRGKKKN